MSMSKCVSTKFRTVTNKTLCVKIVNKLCIKYVCCVGVHLFNFVYVLRRKVSQTCTSVGNTDV
jgi:hypothetical protein